MKARAQLLGLCCGVLLPILLRGSSTPVIPPAEHKLMVRDERDRVVLAWSGPIERPMRDEVVAALDRLRDDRRRIVIALNSPGGSVVEGRETMAAIRDAAQTHEIDTLVEQGAACASMCVAIYLVGSHRMAGSSAHFMFHEAHLDPSNVTPSGLKMATLDAHLREAVEKGVTDLLFDNDYRGPRVNARWLAGVRSRIPGREIWLNAQQLMDENSGVVDALVEDGRE